MSTTDTEAQALEAYRVAMMEELGFSNEEAKKLSEQYYTVTVKGKKGKPDSRVEHRVDYHYVRKLMETGASKEQVVRIIL